MDYIQNIIEEQVKSKKVFNAMLNKWRETNPTLSAEEADQLFTRFSQIQNGLSTKKPQVVTFLFRFDGTDYPRFDPRFIKDITKYSYEQIKFLIDEYSAGEDQEGQVVDDGDFGKVDSHFSEENIEKSRNMWYGDDYKIIDEGTLRVYGIPDQRTSIKFGYYLKYLNQTQGVGRTQWCVTYHSTSNMWSNYRDNRTFYFVIDETRDETDRYHLVALQRDTSTADGYRVTDKNNSGDNTKTWNEVVRLFPKLENHREAIATKRFTRKDELNGAKEIRLVDLISEQAGQYEFKRQAKNIKRRYINSGRVLAKPESWQSMDNELRMLYINQTNDNNYQTRFPSYDFLIEVRKVRNEFGSLDHRLRTTGVDGGVATLFDKLMETDFKVSKTNIENPYIKIYRSRTTKKLGIFNLNSLSWYNKDGVTYEPVYVESKPKLYKNAQNNAEKFFVITYSKMGYGEEQNFYCVIPLARSKTNGYLLSANAFANLKERIVENDFMGILPQSPEGEDDIK